MGKQVINFLTAVLVAVGIYIHYTSSNIIFLPYLIGLIYANLLAKAIFLKDQNKYFLDYS
ncbi:hypothetical protein CAI16_17160 [Virgibacillus dokdonensis]|uniref:Uncharacterized protein n=1 Tax=Virgibacillus dokdonensis TaxID=302167 RepID=A0A3E0WKV3_9BACI|nr:hypothetical protein [Virgibacillus dokdonensis]RFA32727.1 hypothetical protein CAI16_17160 [Virgibacillus dokdonensis]